ncbi:hypothetical protein [Chamaesiphon minutus]|uniref:Chloride channel protein EriC n=1 Tax=Chamaesiphon minutus (strain ATCC 27169 / PCC 6605) TaxID=1173020 RepID=K9UNS8_CHAP6|nr:hypothetical protein [Chamaesiphon minutus]AFY95834.1 hypothetical protein Cha6605_4925 [Chamaesiphon minutus PCC 6605]
MNKWLQLEPVRVIPYLLKWLAIGCTIGILTGTSSAALLATLEWATQWRESHHWILFLLPLGGLSSGLIYHYLGSSVEAGNNLLLEEIHDPRSIIPLRMAPLVLLGTTISHVFRASVAGMLFGLEVLAFGKFRYDGLLPCAIA